MSSLKNPILMGGQEEPKYRGKISLRRGGGVLGQFVDLKGAWQKRGGSVFEVVCGVGLIPQCS